jgi:hypothetical protein
MKPQQAYLGYRLRQVLRQAIYDKIVNVRSLT